MKLCLSILLQVLIILSAASPLHARQITSACDNKNIKAKKTEISESDFIFNISAEDLPCMESQSKYLHSAFKSFQKDVSEKTVTEPEYLLSRQKKLYEDYSSKGASPLFDMILDKKIGTIRDINLLESFIMTEHLKLNGSKTEFVALFLKAPNGDLRVYLSSGNNPDGAEMSEKALSLVGKDFKDGYTLEGHFHNHPFMLDARDISGAVIPSEIDQETYQFLLKEHKLKNAYLTNGFSTIIFEKSEFKKFPKKIKTIKTLTE